MKQYEGLPCIPVESLWWACNSNVFGNKDILQDFTAILVLKLANEFKTEAKAKILRMPSMPYLDFNIPWVFFMVLVKSILCNVELV